MSTIQDVNNDLVAIFQHEQVAEHLFNSLTPDPVQIVAALNAALAACQQAIADVNAFDFGGALRLVPYPARFTFTAGQPFSYQFRGTGGTPPYQFVQSNGTIPSGLTLSPDGLLSGTPAPGTASLNFEFGIWLEDATGNPISAGAVYLYHA